MPVHVIIQPLSILKTILVLVGPAGGGGALPAPHAAGAAGRRAAARHRAAVQPPAHPRPDQVTRPCCAEAATTSWALQGVKESHPPALHCVRLHGGARNLQS